MRHSINNRDLPTSKYSKQGNTEIIELYEIRDEKEYKLYSDHSLEDTKDMKNSYENESSIQYSKLKIVKVEIKFTEIK